MQRNKIDSIIGFAVKAGKVIYGSDSLSVNRRYYLICMCDTTADNTRKKVIDIAQKRNVPLIISKSELCNAVGRNNCKVIALTDKQMSESILSRLDEKYRLISSEVK